MVASAANAYAFYEALNVPILGKIGGLLTLGGFLIIPVVEWLIRIGLSGALVWHLLTHRGKRSWLEWAGLCLAGVGALSGWGAVVSNLVLVVSLFVWFIFQFLQYRALESNRPSLRTIAAVTYCIEFVFQVLSNPIADAGPLELLRQFGSGSLDVYALYWGAIAMNLACMFGVEWLSRAYKACVEN